MAWWSTYTMRPCKYDVGKPGISNKAVESEELLLMNRVIELSRYPFRTSTTPYMNRNFLPATTLPQSYTFTFMESSSSLTSITVRWSISKHSHTSVLGRSDGFKNSRFHACHPASQGRVEFLCGLAVRRPDFAQIICPRCEIVVKIHL